MAVVQHLLGELGSGHLAAEVAEHGVGLPAAHELDEVGVDASAHEGGSASGAERAGTEEHEGDAGDGLEEFGREPESVRDVCRLDLVPAEVGSVAVVVTEDGGIRGSPV